LMNGKTGLVHGKYSHVLQNYNAKKKRSTFKNCLYAL